MTNQPLMPTLTLPERPSLAQLKQQAKDLLRSARRGDPAARARFRRLPAFADLSADALAATSFALHDAQSVLARDYGWTSWNALRDHVEELTLRFDEAVDAFVEAATDGRRDRARRLLARHPGIATAGLAPALVLADAPAVLAALAKDPAAATRPTGKRQWQPLHYLCHTALLHDDPDPTHAEAAVTIARRLLELGAAATTPFPWFHHGVQRPVLWGAVCVTRLLPLARLLLEAGAEPNDGVTLTLAAMNGDLHALDLLHQHGARADHPWATDNTAPLYTHIQWTEQADGVRWLLDHGADANRRNGPQQETALHVAARRGNLAVAQLLHRHGADLTLARADGRTAYALARLNGNDAVADWLRDHDAATDLATVDRFTATAARGDRDEATVLVQNHPGLTDQLTTEHYAVLFQLAERGDADGLASLLACGFDANATDSDGCTPLHRAAYAGRVDTVRVLLDHGASLTALDKEFKAQPLIWAAEGSRVYAGATDDRDHPAVARLLLAAGSPTTWEKNDAPPGPIMEILADWTEASA